MFVLRSRSTTATVFATWFSTDPMHALVNDVRSAGNEIVARNKFIRYCDPWPLWKLRRTLLTGSIPTSSYTYIPRYIKLPTYLFTLITTEHNLYANLNTNKIQGFKYNKTMTYSCFRSTRRKFELMSATRPGWRPAHCESFDCGQGIARWLRV